MACHFFDVSFSGSYCGDRWHAFLFHAFFLDRAQIVVIDGMSFSLMHPYGAHVVVIDGMSPSSIHPYQVRVGIDGASHANIASLSGGKLW